MEELLPQRNALLAQGNSDFANPVDSDGIQSRDITGPVDAFKWKIEEHQTASLLYTVHDTTVGISGVSRTDIVKQLCPS